MSAIRIGGDVVRLQIDIPKSDMQNAIGLAALTDVELEFTVRVAGAHAHNGSRDPKPYGRFWQELFGHRGIANCGPLADNLLLGGETVTAERMKLALRDALGVSSLSREGSPERFEAWAESHHLMGVVTMIRGAKMKLAQIEEEQG